MIFVYAIVTCNRVNQIDCETFLTSKNQNTIFSFALCIFAASKSKLCFLFFGKYMRIYINTELWFELPFDVQCNNNNNDNGSWARRKTKLGIKLFLVMQSPIVARIHIVIWHASPRVRPIRRDFSWRRPHAESGIPAILVCHVPTSLRIFRTLPFGLLPPDSIGFD